MSLPSSPILRAVNKHSSIGYEGPDDELRRLAEIDQQEILRSLTLMKFRARAYLKKHGALPYSKSDGFCNLARDILVKLPDAQHKLSTTRL